MSSSSKSTRDTRWARLLFGVALLLVGGGTCQAGRSTPAATPLRLAIDASWAGTAPMFVALDQGFFQDQGLPVEVSTFTTGKETLNALLAGNADVATVAPTPLAFLAPTNTDVRIIASLSQSNNISLLFRSDRGIVEPTDLRGKVIAVPKGTSADFALSHFLNSVGLQPHEVELVNLGPAGMPPALVRGDIDGYAIWQPHVLNGQKLLPDGTDLFPLDYSFDFFAVSSPEFLKTHPAVATRLLTALIQADRFIQERPSDALDITARQIKIDPTDLQTFWNDFQFPLGLTTEKVLHDLEGLGKWINESKPEVERKPLPDYGVLLDPSFLAKLATNRVH